MDVKSAVLVAYTQNVQPAHSRSHRPSVAFDRQRPETHPVTAADDVVDIYESEAVPAPAGEAVKINLATPEYGAGSYRRIPARGALIDTWA